MGLETVVKKDGNDLTNHFVIDGKPLNKESINPLGKYEQLRACDLVDRNVSFDGEPVKFFRYSFHDPETRQYIDEAIYYQYRGTNVDSIIMSGYQIFCDTPARQIFLDILENVQYLTKSGTLESINIDPELIYK